MPRGSTQISPGATSILPISVKICSVPHFRHHQQFRIRIEEMIIFHAFVGHINMAGHAHLRKNIACGGDGAHPFNKSGGRIRYRHRVPIGSGQWAFHNPDCAGQISNSPVLQA